MAGIEDTPPLYVLGKPDATVFAFGGRDVNIYELSARLKQRGWHAEAQHLPASLHMTISPIHHTIVDSFLKDLKDAVKDLPAVDAEDISEMAAMYGMIGTMTDRKMAREFALAYLDDLYKIS